MADAKTYTTSQLAQTLGIETAEAYDLLRVLVAAKAATKAGTAPKEPGKRGKAETQYQLAADAPQVMSTLLTKALQS